MAVIWWFRTMESWTHMLHNNSLPCFIEPTFKTPEKAIHTVYYIYTYIQMSGYFYEHTHKFRL